mgnify:CR=1 FL=1
MSSRPNLKKFLSEVSDDELHAAFHDFGGHDIALMVQALEKSKKNKKRPTFIIAHTIKGWGLRCAAFQSNHSLLPDDDEIEELKLKQGLSKSDLFKQFSENSKEGKYLKERGESLYSEILNQNEIKILFKTY